MPNKKTHTRKPTHTPGSTENHRNEVKALLYCLPYDRAKIMSTTGRNPCGLSRKETLGERSVQVCQHELFRLLFCGLEARWRARLWSQLAPFLLGAKSAPRQIWYAHNQPSLLGVLFSIVFVRTTQQMADTRRSLTFQEESEDT